MIHVFPTMGTVVSLWAPEGAPLTAVEEVFAALDERFSLYRPDSEAGRIARGDLTLSESSEEMRDAYAESLLWRTATAGAFTPHRPDGVIDLSGTIKARGMEEAGRVLDQAGCRDWMLTVGGDVLTRGTDDGASWTIGIVDPEDRLALLCSLRIVDSRRAVATSGTSERGEHIWRRPLDVDGYAFRQVTVLADDIMTADVLATAIIAGGRQTLDATLDRFDVDVLACTRDSGIVVSGRLRSMITSG